MDRPSRNVVSHGLGAFRMAVEPATENPLRALFGNLGWILPLVGVEALREKEYEAAVVFILSGPICFVIASVRGLVLRAWLADLRRLRIVKAPKPEAIDIVEAGRRKQVRHQIRSHVLALSGQHLNHSHEATVRAIRECIGRLPDYDDVRGEFARIYEYLIETSRHKATGLNVAAMRSLQAAPEETKMSAGDLVDQLVDTANDNFRLWRAMHGLSQLNGLRGQDIPAIANANRVLEQVKKELRDTEHMDGFSALSSISEHFRQ